MQRNRQRIAKRPGTLPRRGTARRRKLGPSVPLPMRTSAVNNHPSPFPLTKRAYLTMGNLFDLTAAATHQEFNFQANSLFDFFFTHATHQPLGFDQMCSASGPYTRYLVHSVRFEVTCVNHVADETVFWIAAQPSSVAAAVITVSDALERQGLQSKIIHRNAVMPTTLSNFNTTTAMLDVKDVRDERDLRGVYNSNPVRQWYLKAGIVTPSASQQIGTLYVKVVFDVEFTERKTLASSDA